MNNSILARTAMALAIVSLAGAPVAAKKAAAVNDLTNETATEAERHLQARGFKYIDGRAGNYGEYYSYWWHEDDKDCIVVEANDGQVLTINDAKDKDCHHNGDAGAAVAAVAGVAILGALLAHKSDHHDDKEHFSDANHEKQYDRGYQDGLHHRQYHNYDDSKYYSRGYAKGVQQRNNNSRDHSGYGGYNQQAHFKDLRGDRASSADAAMRQRGFTNVDGFKSGSTAYTIWNRRSSHQCIQMAVANGKVNSIVDIHTHPKCR